MKYINNYLYYFIIAIVSVVSIIVFPMLGSEMGIEIRLPDTIIGWVIYVGSALATAIVNMMIFYGFMQQGKLNVRDNEQYKKANEILLQLSILHPDDVKLPRSPKKWQIIQYSKKGTTLFVGSLLSCFAFTNAILTFNLVTLITYSFTILFAIIFGIFQMKTAEKYWTDEYYRFAEYVKMKYDMEDNKND